MISPWFNNTKGDHVSYGKVGVGGGGGESHKMMIYISL